MFYKLLFVSYCVYLGVNTGSFEDCSSKCICRKEKVSCLNFETADEIQPQPQANDLVLRKSDAKVKLLKKALPYLKTFCTCETKLILEEHCEQKSEIPTCEIPVCKECVCDCDKNKQSTSLIYSLYILPFLLLAFIQAPNFNNLVFHVNLLIRFVLKWLKLMRNMSRFLKKVYRLLQKLKALIGKCYILFRT